METVPFFIADHFLVNSLHPMDGGQQVDIRTHPLQRVLEKEQPDVVIMDIEGIEYELLANPGWKRHSNLRELVVEIHPSPYLTDRSCDLSHWFDHHDSTMSWKKNPGHPQPVDRSIP